MKECELVQNINAYLAKYGIRYANEVRMGIGVPDITLNIGAIKNQELIFDYYLLSIIDFINGKKSVTLSDICNYFSFQQERVQKYVNILLERKIAIAKNSKIRISRNIFNTNLGTTISIEAKLKDWKGGLLQAQRYLIFSDYSYLAIPEDKIQNVDTALFYEYGIGLLSISKYEICEIIQPRLSSECEFHLKYIATSSVLSANLEKSRKRRKDTIFASLL